MNLCSENGCCNEAYKQNLLCNKCLNIRRRIRRKQFIATGGFVPEISEDEIPPLQNNDVAKEFWSEKYDWFNWEPKYLLIFRSESKTRNRREYKTKNLNELL